MVPRHHKTVLCSLCPNYLQFGMLTIPLILRTSVVAIQPMCSPIIVVLELSNQSAIVQLLIGTSRLPTTHVKLPVKLSFEQQNLKRLPSISNPSFYRAVHTYIYILLKQSFVAPLSRSKLDLSTAPSRPELLWPSCNSSPRLEPL